jgi:hypothetical protein
MGGFGRPSEFACPGRISTIIGSNGTAQMAAKIPFQEKDQIVVGKPLPFAVYSHDGQLLLAAGRPVDTERARQMLIDNGTHRSALGADRDKRDRYNDNDRHKPGVLAALQKDYGATSLGRRFAVTMAPNDTHEAYNSWVVGATEQTLIVTAPLGSDGSLVAVSPGQMWLCRTFQVTSAFRFRATVLKVAFEPFPHLHLEAPKNVETRKVRGRPRASVFVNATVDIPPATPCVIVDLSVSGGRVAVDDSVKIARGHVVRLNVKLDMIDFHFDLSLYATVVGAFGASDSRHPDVAFYGLQFDKLTELESLILHGFVNQHLAVELNSLWQVLSTASSPSA